MIESISQIKIMADFAKWKREFRVSLGVDWSSAEVEIPFSLSFVAYLRINPMTHLRNTLLLR